MQRPQRGFTYIGLLIAVAIMGLMLTIVGRIWSTTEQREREAQLLFIGHAYRMAIASYYASGHQFPTSLQDLVQDERFPIPKHHLRRIYADPMTGRPDWMLLPTASGQGIMGVVSSSQRAPLKRNGFEPIDDLFKDADCYCAWQFAYYPNRFARPAGGVTLPPSGPLDNFQPGTITTVTPGSTLTPGAPLPPGGVSGPGTGPN
jgi:type II secretory pathway pseudopilin PulG